MIVYLKTGLFKPTFFLVSIIIFPILAACIALSFFRFTFEILIVTFLFALCCFLIIWGAYKHSKTKKYYLSMQDGESIVLCFPNLASSGEELEIKRDEIVKMEYYKISSIKAWCLLYSYVLPQCTYITYKRNGELLCQLIGYPHFDDIKEVCARLHVNLIVK